VQLVVAIPMALAMFAGAASSCGVTVGEHVIATVAVTKRSRSDKPLKGETQGSSRCSDVPDDPSD
jgi:hypothetical protein